MDELQDYTLPEDLAALADEYDAAVGHRDQFLWKWFHYLNPYFRLSTVEERYESKVQKDKTCLTFYVTLLDDLVDEHNDRITFQEAAKVPFDARRVDEGRAGVDGEWLAFARRIWEEVEESLRMAPRFREFRDLVEYDLRQTLNAVRYAYIVNNHPYVANMTEAYAYSSHNMVLLAFADIDLMHSRQFNREELGTLRRILWTAQKMARIGNWVSTWKRELLEGDFSSGVLVYAYENGVVSDDDLRQLWTNPTADVVESVTERVEREDVRETLLDQWQRYYDEIERAPDMDSVDVDGLLVGMEKVMEFHLDSEGMK